MADMNNDLLEVPITRVFPPDLKSHFVTHMTVQHQEEHFVLCFYEVWLPPILGTDSERRAEAEKIKSVEAKCVARIVVSPTEMKRFLDAANENFAGWQSRTTSALQPKEE